MARGVGLSTRCSTPSCGNETLVPEHVQRWTWLAPGAFAFEASLPDAKASAEELAGPHVSDQPFSVGCTGQGMSSHWIGNWALGAGGGFVLDRLLRAGNVLASNRLLRIGNILKLDWLHGAAYVLKLDWLHGAGNVFLLDWLH